MKQCLKITVTGKVQGVGYREFVKKSATQLEVEGVIQNLNEGHVTLNVCGTADTLDKFIGILYQGSSKSKVENVAVEPLVNEKDFRGVFRIID